MEVADEWQLRARRSFGERASSTLELLGGFPLDHREPPTSSSLVLPGPSHRVDAGVAQISLLLDPVEDPLSAAIALTPGSEGAPFNVDFSGALTSLEEFGPGRALKSGGPCSDRSALETCSPASSTDGASVACGAKTSVHAQVPRLALRPADNDVDIFASLSSHETSDVTVTSDSGRVMGDSSACEGGSAFHPTLYTSGASSASRHSTRRESGSTSSGAVCPGPSTPSRPSTGSTQLAMADRLNSKLQRLSDSNTGEEREADTEAVLQDVAGTPGCLQRNPSQGVGDGGEESSHLPHEHDVGLLNEQENDLEAELASMDTALRDLHHSLLASPSVSPLGASNRSTSYVGVAPKQRAAQARLSAPSRTVDRSGVEKPLQVVLVKKAGNTRVSSPRPTRAQVVAARVSSATRTTGSTVLKPRVSQAPSGSSASPPKSRGTSTVRPPGVPAVTVVKPRVSQAPRSASAHSTRAGPGNTRLKAAGTGSAGSSRPGSATSGRRRVIPVPLRRLSAEEGGCADIVELQEMVISRSSTCLPRAASTPSVKAPNFENHNDQQMCALTSAETLQFAEQENEIPAGGTWAVPPLSSEVRLSGVGSSAEIVEDAFASSHIIEVAAACSPPPPERLVVSLSLVRAPEPDVPSFTSALLADAREELSELALTADLAASTCVRTAPLAQMLRAAVDRELGVLAAVQAADPSDSSLPRRIMELRASAAQGQRMLRSALDDPALPQHGLGSGCAPQPHDCALDHPSPRTSGSPSTGGPARHGCRPPAGEAATHTIAAGLPATPAATPGSHLAAPAAPAGAESLRSRLWSLEVQHGSALALPLSLAGPGQFLLPSPSPPSSWPPAPSGVAVVPKQFPAQLPASQEGLLCTREGVAHDVSVGPQRHPSFGQLLPGREALPEQQKAAGLHWPLLPRSQRTYSFDWFAQDPAPEPAAAFEEAVWEEEEDEEHVSLGAARDTSLGGTAFGTALGGVAADMRRALAAIRAARRMRTPHPLVGDTQ